MYKKLFHAVSNAKETVKQSLRLLSLRIKFGIVISWKTLPFCRRKNDKGCFRIRL